MIWLVVFEASDIDDGKSQDVFYISQCEHSVDLWDLIPLLSMGLSLQLLQFVTNNWISTSPNNPMLQFVKCSCFSNCNGIRHMFHSFVHCWVANGRFDFNIGFRLEMYTNVTLNSVIIMSWTQRIQWTFWRKIVFVPLNLWVSEWFIHISKCIDLLPNHSISHD